MSLDALFEVTRAGLDFERARMDAASRRIAASDMPLAQAQGQAATGFAAQVGVARAAGGAHAVLDPANPAADAQGMVRYPEVDLAQEMTTLMSAQRAYQADIRAFNTLHGMVMKSLDIGRNG